MYAKGAIQMSPLIFVQMKREYDSQLENHTLVIICIVQFNHHLPRENQLEIIKDLIAPGTDLLTKEKSGYSGRAEAVLEESHRQAKRFHSNLTGTEHILMSIIKEGENVQETYLFIFIIRHNAFIRLWA